MSEKEQILREEVDPNLIVETTIDEPDVKFYDVRKEPFEIYGLYDPKNQAVFRRLPSAVAKEISPAVARVSLNTAGGRVRFSTDSKYVAIRTVMPFIHQRPVMSPLGVAGLDLYVDFEEEGVPSRYKGCFRPPVGTTEGYESVLKFPDRRKRYLTIHFPSYNRISALYIGVQEDAFLGEGKKYADMDPIVYYGSSITQGCCTSRPGLVYSNIISRDLNIDHLNFGFSGSGKAEIPAAEYLAGLKMSMFICDYDHNAPDWVYLQETHQRLYDIIRAKHPKIPYIMLSRPDFDVNPPESIRKRNVIADTYRYAREKGDKNVYYIDGAGIFRGPDEDLCSVDGVHPNDMGYAKMADSIKTMIIRALRKKG